MRSEQKSSREPTAISNGLAMYRIGKGRPAFLMPYPHASTHQSISESKLVELLNGLGYEVLTFDPPGIFRSTRKATVTLEEMLSCTKEILGYFAVSRPILLLGHSQGAFCSLAFAIENPTRVERLIVIGVPPGWPAISKGSMHRQFPWYSRIRWEMLFRGFRKMVGLSNLENHKRLDNLVSKISFQNQQFVEQWTIYRGDAKRADPVRAKWMVHLRKYCYDCNQRLNEIRVPVFIGVGRFDPQTPVSMNLEVREKIPDVTFHIFEKSGHSPFLEEPETWNELLKTWLSAQQDS